MKPTEFVNFVNNNINGKTEGFFTIDNEVKMLKTNNSLGKIRRISAVKGAIGFDYSNEVNTNAINEGKEERQTGSRTWGTVSENRAFITHTPKTATTEQTYLNLMVLPLNEGETLPKSQYFNENGEPVEYATIEPFIPNRHSVSSTQKDLDNKVEIRAINLENLVIAKIFGQSIAIEHN